MLTLIRPVALTMVQLIVPVVIGIVFRIASRSNGDTFRSYSRLVITVALPLYFFVRVSKVDLSLMVGGAFFPIAALFNVGLSLALGFLLATAVRRWVPRQARRVAVGAGSFGNSGYLPLSINELLPLSLPAAAEVLGSDISTLFIGAYLLGQSPLLWSVGNWLVSGRAERPRLQEFLPPPVIGILAGLVAAALGVDDLMGAPGTILYAAGLAIGRIADVTVPLVLITLGGLIAGIRVPKGDRRTAILVSVNATVLRLVILPAVFWIVLWLGGGFPMLTVPMLWVLFLEFHAPTANNLGVMAARAGRNEDEIAVTMVVMYVSYSILFPLYLGGFLAYLGLS